jgi:hypothetical protein
MRTYHGIEVKDNSYPQQEIQDAPFEVQASILREALQEALLRYESFKWMVMPQLPASNEEWFRQLTTIKYSTDALLLPDEGA